MLVLIYSCKSLSLYGLKDRISETLKLTCEIDQGLPCSLTGSNLSFLIDSLIIDVLKDMNQHALVQATHIAFFKMDIMRMVAIVKIDDRCDIERGREQKVESSVNKMILFEDSCLIKKII